MPRRPIDGWLPYLDDVLTMWTELGDDFKVGGLTRAQIVEVRTELSATLARLNALQTQIGLITGERDARIAGIETFAVKFRSAVIAEYGLQSVQARRVPRVSPPRTRSASTPPPAVP